MTRFLRKPRAPFSIPFLFALGLFLVAPQGEALANSKQPPAGIHAGAVSTAVAQVCFADSEESEWEWRSILGNRRRMIQVSLVAVCIGIAFLLKGKHG